VQYLLSARLDGLQLPPQHPGPAVLFKPASLQLKSWHSQLSSCLSGVGGCQPAAPFPPSNFGFEPA
jgi:hypothetical protein